MQGRQGKASSICAVTEKFAISPVVLHRVGRVVLRVRFWGCSCGMQERVVIRAVERRERRRWERR